MFGINFLLAAFIGAAPVFEQVEVFEAGTNGYHTYRIPALAVTTRGTLLAFAEGRKDSSSDIGDIDLLLRRSIDGGRTWLEVQTLWNDGKNTCGNPTVVVDQSNGKIWLVVNHNRGTQQSQSVLMAGRGNGDRTVWVMESIDDGLSWSTPLEITATVKRPDWGFYATGPGIGIQLRSGRLVIPSYFRPRLSEAATEKEILQSSRSHIIYSDDHGISWKIGGVSEAKTNECQLVELSDGSLLLNMRSFHERAQRAIATSNDGGLSWSSVHHDRALIEPTCQASLISCQNPVSPAKNLLLFANPASLKRENMTVRVSEDEGVTWRYSKVLHSGPAAYSSLGALGDATFACLYERSSTGEARSPYERITFARFNLEWLKAPAGR